MEERLHNTTSLCPICKRSVEAALWQTQGRIVMRKSCDEHGAFESLIASNAAWYHQVMDHAPTLTPPTNAHSVTQGCPFDCGPCEQHEQQALLPIVPITSACNLDCPICYTHNNNDSAFHMSEAAFDAVLGHLRQSPADRRIINITGGEPTQHPQFDKLLRACRREGIHRVTISTHGLRFLHDTRLVALIAELDARVILSFDSFEEKPNRDMLGGNLGDAKLKILDVLERHGVNTTLLPVLAYGVNHHEVGAFAKLALGRDFIRSLELHTMTFTGQGGRHFQKSARYTTYDVLADLETQTQGQLAISDFIPAPVAHPLCYQVAYLLRLNNDTWLPFGRFMEAKTIGSLMANVLYLEPSQELQEVLQDITMRLWADAIDCENKDDVLAALRALIDDVFAPGISQDERLRRSESRIKAIYIHAHMDEENFDTDRIRQCCVGILEPDGKNIPSCAYNVLYRDRDARFMQTPQDALVTLGAGRRRSRL